MKSVIVSPDQQDQKSGLVTAEIKNVEIPEPTDDQVLIKVFVSGSNPKDWKLPTWTGPHNSGDDIAGEVYKVGKNVTEFKPGDRVAAFHIMMNPHGSFAEYAIAPQHTTFHIPSQMSFEQAATYPLAAMTAAFGLFIHLGLPTPLLPAEKETPLVIYGGSSSVGAFAIKLAKLANIHPIIAVAGSSFDFAKSIGADIVVDYRNGNVIEDLKSALGGKTLNGAFDCISEGDSIKHLNEVVKPEGRIVTLLPTDEKDATKAKVHRMVVGDAHTGTPSQQDFASAYFRLFAHWAKSSRFEPHPYEVVAGGLEGVQQGLQRLQQGKVNATKLVFRISDTPGLSS